MSTKYSICSEAAWSPDQRAHIEKYKMAIQLINENDHLVFGAKTSESRHVMATDRFARMVALECGEEVTGRLDAEMPCEGTAMFAGQFVEEDRQLMASGDPDVKLLTLNIHEYADGLQARLFTKKPLVHHESQSILGVTYSAFDVELSRFLCLIPELVLQFGASGSYTVDQHSPDRQNGLAKMTEYEQEVALLIVLNWRFNRIAAFMNHFRPREKPRSADSIIKIKNALCAKLGLCSSRVTDLRACLVHHGFHRKIPRSLLAHLIGSQVL